jgi:multidrug efflux pump subunit AcrB
MNLTEFAVKRHQFTIVVFALLAALGVSAFVGIPKAEDPTFPIAGFAIVTVLPGANPTDIERLVVDPIESRLKTLDDIKNIKTEISDSLSLVRVEFLASTDPARKRDEVFREMAAVKSTLPAEVIRFDVFQFNAKDVNILQAAILAEGAPYDAIANEAQRLKRRLEGADGVGKVEITGLPRQQVRVDVDLERAVALRISPLEVVQAIGAESTNIPAGAVEAGTRRYSVKTSGDYASVAEIEDTVVRGGSGASVRVRDLATVVIGSEDSDKLARLNGKRAVFIAATQKEGQNIFNVREALMIEVAAASAQMPPGMQLVTAFDQSRNVAHRLGGFARDFGIAILLVLVTLLPLGLRASGVVMVSIPLSIAIGLFLLKMTGYSINQLSIVGFVIALGLLVDDSVVVVENITRFIRSGVSPKEAAIAATKQMQLSVLGCTATLIFAFLPLLALPGTAGQFIRSLPLAVVFTILASLLVSLTIVPFLSSMFLRSDGEHGNKVFQVMNRAIEVSYGPLLGRSLAHPGKTLAIAGGLFIGSLALVPVIGFSVFPKAGTPQFLVVVEADQNANLAETDRAARFAEKVLNEKLSLKFVATSVGVGNPQIYYNLSPNNERSNVAEIFAEVDHFDPKKTPLVFDEIRHEFAQYAGARIELKEFENGPPVEAPIAFRLIGEDMGALHEAAAIVEKTLLAVPGTRDVRNPTRDVRTDLRVVTDRDKAAMLGVSQVDVDRSVRLGIGGLSGGKYRAAGSEEAYDIRVGIQQPGKAADLSSFDRIYVGTNKGSSIPLSQVATVSLMPSPTKINHYNKERSATVTSHVKTGENTDRITNEVIAKLGSLNMPKGVRLVVAGDVENRKESFGGLGTAILIAIFGVFAVLVLEFRTFKSTLIVASVIPLGIIGGMVALLLSGNTLSFTAIVGFIALMGIEVKNSILLVDFTNQLREEGMDLDTAIQRAGEIRFVPILLTTLTAVGGLIPLVMERSPLYSPLALVILGGLVSSTVLTRLVTPVMYKLLAPEILPADAAVAATVPHTLKHAA